MSSKTNLLSCLAVVTMALLTASNAFGQDFTYSQADGGNLDTPENWTSPDGVTTGVFPTEDSTAIVNVDATFPNAAGALILFGPVGVDGAEGSVVAGSGNLIFGGNTTLTAGTDVVASRPQSVTFNDVIVNVGDDIFTGGAASNYIFNDGSETNVRDDFEANGGGTITINGGVHTLLNEVNTSNFGAQNGSTLNFLGGTVTGATLFRTTNADSVLNIGGDASIQTATTDWFAGTVDIASDWVGVLDSGDLDTLADYEALFVGSQVTLDGNLINSTVFNANFELNGDGVLTMTGSPSIFGDVNGDMVVDCFDIDEYSGNLGPAAANPSLDLVADGTISTADAALILETIVTPSGTGAIFGDVNCDGQVNVLGDALILVQNLGMSDRVYTQGDLNLDGQVNVLGDALILVQNLGM